MIIETQNTKNCKNCSYYLKHYIKKEKRYVGIAQGHCGNINIKNFKALPNCQYWEDVSLLKEKRKQSIKETLLLMQERLDELAMLLKEDAE